MKNKFQMDQEVILTKTAFGGMVSLMGKSPDTPARFGGVCTVQQVYETTEKEYPSMFRYQISSLWFDEGDLIPVNKTDDPEYYL